MAIDIKQLECDYDKLEDEVLPILINKVFHVSSGTGYASIKKDHQIKHNKDHEFEFTFGQSENSYGRKRGYICLFDLRGRSVDDIKSALMKYYFLNPPFCENQPYFLIISSKLHESLIDWEKAKEEIGFKEMYVPRVECWYPGNISLDYVCKVIKLTVNHPKDSLAELMNKIKE